MPPLPVSYSLFAATILFISMLACAPQGPQPTRPAPELPPQSAPPSIPPDPVTPPPFAFTYSLGRQQYLLTTDATLSIQTDSAPPLPSQATTRVIYTLDIQSVNPELRIAGSIDSISIDRGSRIPPPTDEALHLPLHWTSLSPDSVAADDSTCTIAQELIQGARELLPRLPTTLPPGHHWQETTTRSLCRARIPITASATHHYEVNGPSVFQGDSVLQITRITKATLGGQQQRDGKPISVTGSASSTARFYLLSAAGQLTARTEESRTDILIRTPRGESRLTQELRSHLAPWTP